MEHKFNCRMGDIEVKAELEIVNFNDVDVVRTSNECLDPSGEYFPDI